MLGRTVLLNAGRQTYLDTMSENGEDVVRITVPGQPCPACAIWENRLLSITGKTEGLPLLEEAIIGGLFHPNCTHSIVAVGDYMRKNEYHPDGRPKEGLNSPGNEETNTKDDWSRYRKQQSGSEKNKIEYTKPNTPTSKAIEIRTTNPEIKQAAKEALGTIDSVHTSGELQKIPLMTKNLGNENYGVFNHLKNGNAVSIMINPSAPTPLLTIVHETGHLLDFTGLSLEKGSWGTQLHPYMEHWKKAVHNSDSIKTLTKKLSIAGLDTEHIKYLLDDKEIWARSYAQYIATSSQNPKMLKELASTFETDYGKVYNNYWSATDFEPIKQTIDELFKEIGWK